MTHLIPDRVKQSLHIVLYDNSLIIDIGTINNMTYNRAWLTKIRTLAYPFLISLPNGYNVKVIKIGDAYLTPTLTFTKYYQYLDSSITYFLSII